MTEYEKKVRLIELYLRMLLAEVKKPPVPAPTAAPPRKKR